MVWEGGFPEHGRTCVRGATVAGRVLDLAGEPAEDVDVRALHEDIEPYASNGLAGTILGPSFDEYRRWKAGSCWSISNAR